MLRGDDQWVPAPELCAGLHRCAEHQGPRRMRGGVRGRARQMRVGDQLDADAQLRQLPIHVLQRGGRKRMQAGLRFCIALCITFDLCFNANYTRLNTSTVCTRFVGYYRYGRVSIFGEDPRRSNTELHETIDCVLPIAAFALCLATPFATACLAGTGTAEFQDPRPSRTN